MREVVPTGHTRFAPAAQIMEICGTHTMSIAGGLAVAAAGGTQADLRARLSRLRHRSILHGPGDPPCAQPGIVIATYGDMVRVPGREGSLAEARAAGATVEIVYSAHQAVELAKCQPEKQVVFLAVGFETTAPGMALAGQEAAEAGLENFCADGDKLVLPAMNPRRWRRGMCGWTASSAPAT